MRKEMEEILDSLHEMHYTKDEAVTALLSVFEKAVPEEIDMNDLTDAEEASKERKERFRGWNACRQQILDKLNEARGTK